MLFGVKKDILGYKSQQWYKKKLYIGHDQNKKETAFWKALISKGKGKLLTGKKIHSIHTW